MSAINKIEQAISVLADNGRKCRINAYLVNKMWTVEIEDLDLPLEYCTLATTSGHKWLDDAFDKIRDDMHNWLPEY
jgi:hypothetical protein